jgi:hypothetical protein
MDTGGPMCRFTPCAVRSARHSWHYAAAEKAGHRFGWRYYRDLDPSLVSIRNEPEFKAVFVNIERDMTQQRAQLAAIPKDAPLGLAVSVDQ